MIPDWVGQHTVVVLVTCATVGPLSWALGRAERRGRRLLRRLSVVALAEEWRQHRNRLLRGEVSIRLAEEALAEVPIRGIAHVPFAEPAAPVAIAGSDLPPRGANVDLSATLARAERAPVAGLEWLSRHGRHRPNPGYRKPPPIRHEPRYVQPGGRYGWSTRWSELIPQAVLDYRPDGEKPAVEAPGEPVLEETHRKPGRDDDEPPTPSALTLTPVSVTAIRRSSLLPSRMHRNAGRHAVGAAHGLDSQPWATAALAAVSGPPRCLP